MFIDTCISASSDDPGTRVWGCLYQTLFKLHTQFSIQLEIQCSPGHRNDDVGIRDVPVILEQIVESIRLGFVTHSNVLEN